MSLRRAVARQAGDGDLSDAVAGYETSSLHEPCKEALRLTDAFLSVPGLLAPSHNAGARHHLTRAQIVELCLKLIAFSSNKTTVAFGLDAPAHPEKLASLRYEDGLAIVTLTD